MEPDCFFQVWSSDPVPEDRFPIFEPPSEDLDAHNIIEETVYYTKSSNRKMVDLIRKGNQFEYLTEMFIEICDAKRMDMKRGNLEKKEKIFFTGIKTFDQEVEKWNSVHSDDLHSFFAVRLVHFLEIRAIDYQCAVDIALAVSYTAEINFDGSTSTERTIHDSARAVNNAYAIVESALSNIRIAKTLVKK
jgi:hypothetical protein